jgi:hypothetical protein
VSDQKEFFIITVVQGEYCWADGRCGDVPIRVGDFFESMYQYEVPHSLGDYARKAAPTAVALNVMLRVDAIQSYGHELDHLSKGMTGTLMLSGSGVERLAPGFVLGPALPIGVTQSGHIGSSQHA